MTNCDYKRYIEYNVSKLNELTGETYEVEFGKGGCRLLKYVNNCPHNGTFGDTMIKRSPAEMVAYLDGLVKGLTNVKH